MDGDSSPGSLRGWLNQNPLVVVGIAVVAILIALAVWRFSASPGSRGQMFFSMDDGKTYFPGPPRAAPYMKGGKEVLQAYVYLCDGKPFVGYLRRFPDSIRAQVDKQLAQPNPGPLPPGEIRKPGETKWQPQAAMETVRCPDGKAALLHVSD